MKDILKYKEFIGTVHYSTEDNVFFGKIEGIHDLIVFEGTTVNEIQQAFQEAVEDYISLCKQTGKALFKSYRGSFNIRISPDLHRKAVNKSCLLGMTLNQFVKKAIEDEVAKS
jgi:predicted HicB family RNase H-like nuclease